VAVVLSFVDLAASDETELRPLFGFEFSGDAADDAGLVTARRLERMVEAMPPVAAEKPSGRSEVPKLWETRRRRFPMVDDDVDLGDDGAVAVAVAVAVSTGGGKGSLVDGCEVAIG
jgi:hypothetical protein